MPVVIINRPSSSGTRATFKKYALEGMDEAQGLGLTEDSNGTVKKTIGETDGAISYIGLSYLDATVKAIKLDGVEANAANIADGKYPIWAYEHMYTKGEPTGTAKKFIDYIMTDEVQKGIIAKLKYVSILDMKVQREN